jgi:hypothetical protein
VPQLPVLHAGCKLTQHALLHPCENLAHARLSDPQLSGDLALGPASLGQAPRLASPEVFRRDVGERAVERRLHLKVHRSYGSDWRLGGSPQLW